MKVVRYKKTKLKEEHHVQRDTEATLRWAWPNTLGLASQSSVSMNIVKSTNIFHDLCSF